MKEIQNAILQSKGKEWIMDIHNILIQEVIDMSEVPFPDIEDILKYVKMDLRFNRIIGSVKKSFTETYLSNFYKEMDLKFKITYKKGKGYSKSGRFSFVHDSSSVIFIETTFPPNPNPEYIATMIRRVLIHEMVHSVQYSKKHSERIEKLYQNYHSPKSDDNLKTINYYMQHAERGAEMYAMARMYFKDPEAENFHKCFKETYPKLIDAINDVWPSLSNMQKKKIKSSLERMRREYLNQLYNLQKKYGKVNEEMLGGSTIPRNSGRGFYPYNTEPKEDDTMNHYMNLLRRGRRLKIMDEDPSEKYLVMKDNKFYVLYLPTQETTPVDMNFIMSITLDEE